jgi:low affinity Fe/Cu permease
MEVSWTIIGVIGVAVVVLIGYLIRQNQKDEHKLEQFLNNDYKKEDEEELDTDNDQEN